MPQSLALVLVHIIFSTKNRTSNLTPHILPELHPYLATVIRNQGCEAYAVGGTADHVHLAIRLNRTLTIADLIGTLKTSSSAWLKTKSPSLTHFAWQTGYAAFSIAPSGLEPLRRYIETQQAHHRRRSFQDEYRAFLTKYNIDFDERYLWD